jgi:hypothetical protein
MSQKTKHRKYMREWTARNPEKKATNDANSYRRHRDERLEKAAAYRRKNRKKIKAWQRAYQKRCPRVFRASWQRWNSKPENRLTALFAKARLRGHPYELRVKYALRANPPTHCSCCRKLLDYSVGRGMNKDDSPSLDRWDNTKGYLLDNVRIICYRCNELKRDGTLEEFKNLGRYTRK